MSRTAIYLYGPPGSGKTTLGKILADTLELPFFDLDAEIEKRHGETIPVIFSTRGEAAFREMEKQEIEKLITLESAVVALGGGTLINPKVNALVDGHGTVLCLHAAPAELLSRLSEEARPGAQKRSRPLLAGDAAAKLEGLLSQRADHYASFPLRLDTTQLDPDRAAWAAQMKLGRFRVRNASQPYNVIIQPGGLDTVGERIAQQGLHGPVALVTDTNSGRLYAARAAASLERAGLPHQQIVLQAGELYKTIESVQALWEGFLDAGLERSSAALALGGGVIGDLTGFAAATFMRGIRWVNLPTSLLAMVDASLGGKTGVDIPRGKNLVGAFHPPAFVLADPDSLSTLPEAEFRSGMAEVVKHGIIGDPGLFQHCAAFNGDGELRD